jgi:murein DD-endopeptidase MepM/ murein hydrolase activator NlpD
MRLHFSSLHRALVCSTIVLAATAVGTVASAHEAPTATSSDRALVLSALACPVAGAASFADSWGDARSGGRRHEGVDMAADRGTPVVATLAGFAEFKNTRAGGKSVWLTTADGGKFFYAHLGQWEGDSRDVGRGEVIGYVGSTGNAGGPHLHFEVRPGGEAINPYPPTAQACAPEPEPTRRAATLLFR